ncbi:aspartyl protease family protein [Shewanella eurypsychrophilus]|uniref:Aspartyl protease family protein n=1 Tax=Shewanella eurypsychrophilus TaxID=2593656 RepID=A0ABX6V3S8_9GAMM|nr:MULTISPECIES: pepsin/retropepsin-like aspartic protease family protein [Shewanella]QFU21180.1 signal protein PDZ [Shewanella sp. YLB-09]QPG56471.1 aspartyl protease family protein [Shewanella eurypsychrophilus]
MLAPYDAPNATAHLSLVRFNFSLKQACLLLISAFISLFSSMSLAVTEWVDFELVKGHITLPVTVEGFEGRAILDTGAQGNSINQVFINKHELELDKADKIIVRGVYGEEKRQRYSNIQVNLLGADIEMDKLASLRLGSDKNALLLGGAFLRNFIFQFDYPNSRMRLFMRDEIDLAKLENIEMRMDKGRRQPIVKVNLNDQKEAWLIMDTGSNGGIFLKRSTAEDQGWLEEFELDKVSSSGVLGSGHKDAFTLPEIQFGPFTVEDVKMSVPEKGQKVNIFSSGRGSLVGFKGKNIKGLLGYDILKHFVITVDYKGGNMHVGLPE